MIHGTPIPRQRHGYIGVGIFHPKTEANIGTLFRSAVCFGAKFVFTVGRRYVRQSSDTTNTAGVLPLHHYANMTDLKEHLPYACPLVGVELTENAEPLGQFSHPETCAYLLGAEDHGLPAAIIEQCHKVVQIGGLTSCLNVASAGSIVLYDRWLKTRPSRILEIAK